MDGIEICDCFPRAKQQRMNDARKVSEDAAIIASTQDISVHEALYRESKSLRLAHLLPPTHPLFLSILPFTAVCTSDKIFLGCNPLIVRDAAALLYWVGKVSFREISTMNTTLRAPEDVEDTSDAIDIANNVDQLIELLDTANLSFLNYRTIDGESLLSIAVSLEDDKKAVWAIRHLTPLICEIDGRMQTILTQILSRDNPSKDMLASEVYAAMREDPESGMKLVAREVILHDGIGLRLFTDIHRDITFSVPNRPSFCTVLADLHLSSSDEKRGLQSIGTFLETFEFTQR